MCTYARKGLSPNQTSKNLFPQKRYHSSSRHTSTNKDDKNWIKKEKLAARVHTAPTPAHPGFKLHIKLADNFSGFANEFRFPSATARLPLAAPELVLAPPLSSILRGVNLRRWQFETYFNIHIGMCPAPNLYVYLLPTAHLSAQWRNS